MTSAIDASKPAQGFAYTADMRNNFAAARDEITNLQALVADLQSRVSALEAGGGTTPPAQLTDDQGRVLTDDQGRPITT